MNILHLNIQKQELVNDLIKHHPTLRVFALQQNIESDVEHVMTFIHNPDDNEDEITAVCCRDNSSVTVDQTKQSIAVWFKVCQSHALYYSKYSYHKSIINCYSYCFNQW